MFAQGRGQRVTYHNGEGVYIGTSPQATTNRCRRTTRSHTGSPGTGSDLGSECFDVKEHAHDNRLQGNDCPANTGVHRYRRQQRRAPRLREAAIRNTVASSPGTRLKIQRDGAEYDDGAQHRAKRNAISVARADTRKIKANAPQGRICGNVWGVPLAADGVAVGAPAPRVSKQHHPRC